MRIEGSAAVDIQTQRPVEFRQLTVGVFADQAIIAHAPFGQLLHSSVLQNIDRFSDRDVRA
jgi:hypothetical protein